MSHSNTKNPYINLSKKKLGDSYSKAMKQIQGELPTASRKFSKFLHNKYIEKTADFISQTIARPNAILTGAVFAFIIPLFMYVVAKNIGYTLSGFETIGAFALGWVVGIVYDYLKALFTGKNI
ncbi:MAG: hypothetical protein WCJ36_03540 [Candidatus Saccharibacteria bacterium]